MSDLTDRLTDRLREAAEMWCEPPELLVEAAERIEELEREVAECPFHGPVAHWDLP